MPPSYPRPFPICGFSPHSVSQSRASPIPDATAHVSSPPSLYPCCALRHYSLHQQFTGLISTSCQNDPVSRQPGQTTSRCCVELLKKRKSFSFCRQTLKRESWRDSHSLQKAVSRTLSQTQLSWAFQGHAHLGMSCRSGRDAAKSVRGGSTCRPPHPGLPAPCRKWSPLGVLAATSARP